MEDDDDSDYGHSKKRGKKVIRRGRPDKKEKKSPKPRLKATGERSSPSAAVFVMLPVVPAESGQAACENRVERYTVRRLHLLV